MLILTLHAILRQKSIDVKSSGFGASIKHLMNVYSTFVYHEVQRGLQHLLQLFFITFILLGAKASVAPFFLY